MSGHSKSRKKRGGHEEEHENHERWLVTYADMLTLLMVLFIVLFAISQVDQKKFAALKNGLAAGFGAPAIPFAGSDVSVVSNSGQGSPLNLAAGVGGDPLKPEDKAIQQAVQNADRAKQQARQQAAQQEAEHLEEIEEKIKAALIAQGAQNSVQFTIDERGLVVTVITSSVVFAGDRADLLPDGRKLIDALGPTLAGLPNRIEVDGHTNQLNVATVNYPSGWELSSARASAVVRYLSSQFGVPYDRMTACGFADTKPLYPATDPRSVTLNRRVEVVVLSTLPAAERSLLPSAVGSGDSGSSTGSSSGGGTEALGSTGGTK